MFESLLYNQIYSVFIESEDFISENQPGFKQDYSCINLLLSITHDISKTMYQGFEVSGGF